MAAAAEDSGSGGGSGGTGGGAIAGFGIARILEALPHRYPMLLVDRVVSLDPGEAIRAVKAVSFNEPFFQGHFPSRPIMPGVLQIEALAQAAGILAVESFGPVSYTHLTLPTNREV